MFDIVIIIIYGFRIFHSLDNLHFDMFIRLPFGFMRRINVIPTRNNYDYVVKFNSFI